ncbi:DUF427 domain-containing protein [Vallicoccus soli]|uniref:DUF427 domain-containing protein n=1 Tax=Vallicoccus soli TaxID=2339232 RepID=A0A3A3Z361_9ACTN|nr:DUF427 domain-containing protein [Vallicoccus soli]
MPEPAGPGQESVWDYPRPPRLEPAGRHVVVELGGVVVVETRDALRVLETSHPPVYYLPLADAAPGALVPGAGRVSLCEYKGWARSWTVVAGGRREVDAGWDYPDPVPGYAALRGHVALYADRMDRCLVDGEPVRPQPGGFYGGWVTSWVRGPVKGGPGSYGW